MTLLQDPTQDCGTVTVGSVGLILFAALAWLWGPADSDGPDNQSETPRHHHLAQALVVNKALDKG